MGERQNRKADLLIQMGLIILSYALGIIGGWVLWGWK